MSDQLCPGCPGDPNETCCKPELRVKVWIDKQKADMTDQKTEQKPEHEKRIRDVLGTVPLIGDEWVWREGERNEWGSRCFEIDAADGSVEELATAYSRHNAQFIAACNPAAIRALLADLDAVRGALTEVCSLDPHKSSTTEWNVAFGKCAAALKGASHE